MTDEELYLWFGMMSRMTHIIKKKIADHYGGLRSLWHVSEGVLRNELTGAQADCVLENRSEAAVSDYRRRLESKNVTWIYPGHEFYPEALSNIPDAPSVLFVRGNACLLKKLPPCVAVVGARKASAYGIAMADRIAERLAGEGIGIVSGLALGIDVAAHRAVMRVGGMTAAVLGCGINVPYPRENYDVYRRICEDGVLLSEYGLDVKPEAFRFPHRNRIISGMSCGVLVVEARERSGSLITADQALEQGRDVYAVPGRAADPASAGCNNLIKSGAICVTSAEDILCVIKPETADKTENLDSRSGDIVKNLLAPQEKKVYSCVRLEPEHMDDICLEAGISVSEAAQILYELEKKKLVKQLIRNYYVRA